MYVFAFHRAQPEVRRYFTADDIPAPVSSARDADVTAEVKRQTDATRALDQVCWAALLELLLLFFERLCGSTDYVSPEACLALYRVFVVSNTQVMGALMADTTKKAPISEASFRSLIMNCKVCG